MRSAATKRPARRFRVSRTLSDEVRLCQRAVSTVCLKVEAPSRQFTIPILALCNQRRLGRNFKAGAAPGGEEKTESLQLRAGGQLSKELIHV
jgi:hypothetical protein